MTAHRPRHGLLAEHYDLFALVQKTDEERESVTDRAAVSSQERLLVPDGVSSKSEKQGAYRAGEAIAEEALARQEAPSAWTCRHDFQDFGAATVNVTRRKSFNIHAS